MNRLNRRSRVRGGGTRSADFTPRPMCFRCARPRQICHCHEIPQIPNQTELLLVQHIRERSHPFNTARMVRNAFNHVVSVVDYAESMPGYDRLIKDGAALLYPSRNARRLDDSTTDSRPSQLVVLDGTWHQAKRLFRNWPSLQRLPHYRLDLGQPGQYRIREEPDDHSLSTVEAVVAAFRILEPGLAGLDRLLNAFETMVANQLAHPSACYQRSSVPRKQKINIPRCLIENYDRLVVAYGEATPCQHGRWDHRSDRPPVYWVAKRLETGDLFAEAIQSPTGISGKYMENFDLPPSHFDHAVSQSCFRKRWQQFARGDDILVVYNASTLRLLRAVGSDCDQSIELKSINFDPGRKFSSLGRLFDACGIDPRIPDFPGRAGLRLRNAETLVELLRSNRCWEQK